MNLRQQLKFTARGFLQTAKPSPQLFGMAAIGIMSVLNYLGSRVTGEAARNEAIAKAADLYVQNQNADQFLNAVTSAQMSGTQALLDILISLTVLMVSTGVVIYVISEARYHKGDFGNLLDGLSVLGRVLLYQIITSVLTALWSLLLVIPGIVASYRYRQGLYILLDHPEMSVPDCIRASKHMMKGHKLELFWIDMSFLGWTMGQSFCLTAMTYALGAETLVPTLLVLPMSGFIRMYMEFTQFLYYEHLHGVHYDTSVPTAEVG